MDKKILNLTSILYLFVYSDAILFYEKKPRKNMIFWGNVLYNTVGVYAKSGSSPLGCSSNLSEKPKNSVDSAPPIVFARIAQQSNALIVIPAQSHSARGTQIPGIHNSSDNTD
jgi:hypothetical protein